MAASIRRFIGEEEGQDLIEYALLATFVAVATIGAIQFLASNIGNRYNGVGTILAGGS